MSEHARSSDAPPWFSRALAVRPRAPRGRGRRRGGALPGLGARRERPDWSWCTAARRTPAGGTTSPRSSTSHRVVALDLTGHGDSDRRDGYDMHQWAREVLAVIEAEELDRPVVVGHSMGGWVAATDRRRARASAVTAIAILDSPLNDQPPEEERLQERRQPTRVYPSARGGDGALQHDPAAGRGAALRARAHRPADRCGRSRAAGRGSSTRSSSAAGCCCGSCCRELGCPVALFRCEHGLVASTWPRRWRRWPAASSPSSTCPPPGITRCSTSRWRWSPGCGRCWRSGRRAGCRRGVPAGRRRCSPRDRAHFRALLSAATSQLPRPVT